MKASPFTCVICERHKEERWPGPIQSRSIPPICGYCEQVWGTHHRLDGAGDFRDRRIAIQIKALAAALDAAAWRQQNRGRYGG